MSKQELVDDQGLKFAVTVLIAIALGVIMLSGCKSSALNPEYQELNHRLESIQDPGLSTEEASSILGGKTGDSYISGSGDRWMRDLDSEQANLLLEDAVRNGVPVKLTTSQWLRLKHLLDKASVRTIYLDKAELQEVKGLLSAFLLSKEYKEAEAP